MSKSKFEKILVFEEEKNLRNVFGSLDEHLKLLEKSYHIKIYARGTTLVLNGEEDAVLKVSEAITKLYELSEQGHQITKSSLKVITKTTTQGKGDDLGKFLLEKIYLSSRKTISPKSQNQKQYIDALKKYDIVIAIGPAGTGKTYLAVAMAISALNDKQVNRIILARPAVEAGEKLGYLPGDMYEKVNPYLRPLYDALYEMMDLDKAARLTERGNIEIAPLAFMRGRTLNNCFAILDEAQNTTSEQMKMFLTRLGNNCKAVITGDITQVDLPEGKSSGLIEAQTILSHIEGLKFIYFDETDVVRHVLVKKIIKAYENSKKNNKTV